VGALLVAILAVAATPTFAQVTGAVKVGVNFSKGSFEDDGESESSGQKAGLAIGVGVDVPIVPMFSFAPEVLYSMKGGKGGNAFGDDDGNKLKLDQVQIPLLFKAKFAGGSATPFIVAGPGIGFTTSAKFEQEAFDEEEDIKDEVETVDFSGIVGVGVEFGQGIIEYRYDHGFRDLDKNSDATAKLRTHTILFGFRFGGM
jgi:hypothetical protein